MEFTVEFYETNAGRRPVEEFLLKLKASDPDDFAAVMAGISSFPNSWSCPDLVDMMLWEVGEETTDE
jgi:hypothetical protein